MWQTLVVHCSQDRLNKYLGKVAEDQVSAEFLYVANQQVSESLYPLLSILEVSLRNRVHKQLHTKFGSSDWWDNPALNIQAFANNQSKISKAKSKIYHRTNTIADKQKIKASQIVAELSFNFWTDLFDEELQNVLWSDLMLCFPHIPKESKKRRKVAKPLSNLTRLRNRVMHHEPILFDASALPADLHSKGRELLSWMSQDMAVWLAKNDRFDLVWSKYTTTRTHLDKWLACQAALNTAHEIPNNPSLTTLYRARDQAKEEFHLEAKKYLG